jgi:hypothetical protein
MNQGFSLQLLIKNFLSRSAITIAFSAFKPADLSAICFNASTHIRIHAFTIERLSALHLIEPVPQDFTQREELSPIDHPFRTAVTDIFCQTGLRGAGPHWFFASAWLPPKS